MSLSIEPFEALVSEGFASNRDALRLQLVFLKSELSPSGLIYGGAGKFWPFVSGGLTSTACGSLPRLRSANRPDHRGRRSCRRLHFAPSYKFASLVDNLNFEDEQVVANEDEFCLIIGTATSGKTAAAHDQINKDSRLKRFNYRYYPVYTQWYYILIS